MPERTLFGAALRDWRERVSPSAVGLADGSRRRTRGLRREELAELAGVSADYLKRLEQGRGHPSAGVVNSLAGALRLDRADHENLCALAGHAAEGGRVPRRISPGAQRLLDRLDGTPVCLCDAAWTVLGWNAAWQSLQCGDDPSQGEQRNLARKIFGVEASRVHRSPERQARFEATLVADLRSAALRYPADEELAALIRDLRAGSTSFRTLWASGSTSRHDDDQVIMTVPGVGDITMDCDLLTVRDGDLRAIVFTAEPGSPDADRLKEPRPGDKVGQVGDPPKWHGGSDG
jgi:transcriptional regulator with XRE-family HTH domain